MGLKHNFILKKKFEFWHIEEEYINMFPVKFGA